MISRILIAATCLLAALAPAQEQPKAAKKKTKGGIILTSETRETDAWNTQIAKVLRVGELAFKNRTTMERWPEGNWCEPGDFVRVPSTAATAGRPKRKTERTKPSSSFSTTSI